MQPRTLWVKRDATEATVAKYLLNTRTSSIRCPFVLLDYLKREKRSHVNPVADGTSVRSRVDVAPFLLVEYVCKTNGFIDC